MEVSDPFYGVYYLRLRFWHQRQFNGGRTSPHQCDQKIFKMLNRLGRSKLTRFNCGLELL